MRNIKVGNWNLFEIFGLSTILLGIITHAIIKQDNPIALISAVCGITYTFIAGKGNPICYLFGVTGSSFYCILSYQNALWGNLLLYAMYYLPMQVLGYFQWSKNLKSGKSDIVKIKMPLKDLSILISIMLVLSTLAYLILLYLGDKHPLLDSITTIFSLGGMYLTVRRAIEQWQFWMLVNSLAFIMWLNVALSGTRVYSTVAMWGVYLILAFYFYYDWKKDLNSAENDVH